MKPTVRILAFLLVLLLSVGMLAACGGGDPATTTKPQTTSTPTTTRPSGTETSSDSTESSNATTGMDWSKWEALDFSDLTLRIAYNDVVNQTVTDAGTGNSLVFLRGPDDMTGTTRGDYKAAYERHERVLAALDLTPGVNFEYVMAGWDKNCDSILPTIQAYNASNLDDAPNIVIHQNYGMVRAGILGELYNALDPEEENYFDLTHDNWYLEMMQENTIDHSKIYMLLGDYFIDQLRFAFGILVNSQIAEDTLQIFGGIDHIYDLVDSGQWTYDKMMELAGMAYTGDTGESLVMGVVSDQWIVRSFFSASGIDVFKRDANGEAFYVAGTEVDPVHDWMDKLLSMEREDYFSYYWAKNPKNTAKNSPATTFINGGAFFAISQMVLSLEGTQVQNMASAAGILPTPKYVPNGDEFNDDSTDYRSLVSDNANAGGILISSSPAQFTAASAFIQAMTEASDEFFEEYFVNGLQYKNNSLGPRHVDMLNYIHDGICCPMSMLYDNYCSKSLGNKDVYQTYGAIMNGIMDAGSNTFSSDWAGQLEAKVTKWESIKTNFGSRVSES